MVKPRNRPPLSARSDPEGVPGGLAAMMAAAEEHLLEPYRGLAGPTGLAPGLFPIEATGVPTRPLREAAQSFLASLSSERRAAASFPIDSDAWRRWNNMHPYFMRHGVCLEELDEVQCARALELLASCLSTEGFSTARDVMRLNETLREITASDSEYGEWLYWVSIFGEPSDTEPWGFQFDGHHLIVNCFVLGDQIVMTPLFLGSEPVLAETGKYRGTRVFAHEESLALDLAQLLDESQYSAALLGPTTPNEIFTSCYRDNFELNFEGVSAADLGATQRDRLHELIACHLGRVRDGHREVKLAEVDRHFDDTFFAWMGARSDDGVFYYRVHSPVVLIEFDHESGVALDNDEPTRNHIHSVVRTPNGNDYGMDLLRQHYALSHV